MTTLTANQIAQIPSRSLPIGPQLSYILEEFTTLSLSLFSILSSPHPTSTTPIVSSLATLDQKLATLLSLAASHQIRQSEIEQLQSTLTSTNSTWLTGTTSLHSSLQTLKPLLQSGQLDSTSISQTSSLSLLSPEILLSYARLLAPFTSAPPSSLFSKEMREGTNGNGIMDPSGRGLPGDVGALPPFPREGEMRRGRLQFGPMGREGEGGERVVGESGEVGVRREEVQHPVTEELDAVVKLQMKAKLLEGKTNGSTSSRKEEFSFDLDLNPHM